MNHKILNKVIFESFTFEGSPVKTLTLNKSQNFNINTVITLFNIEYTPGDNFNLNILVEMFENGNKAISASIPTESLINVLTNSDRSNDISNEVRTRTFGVTSFSAKANFSASYELIYTLKRGDTILDTDRGYLNVVVKDEEEDNLEL